ncbi:MAG TPA: translation initiation factor IF-2, partial [Verrucomicrobiae bacterium]|nr:translation initiation factor IF-2 [Verrucomicrobiae bacterium]
MPVRIYDIAKKYGLENKEILTKAKALGILAAKVPSSSLDKISAEWLEVELLKDRPELAKHSAAPVQEKPKAPVVEEKIQIITAPPPPPVEVVPEVPAPQTAATVESAAPAETAAPQSNDLPVEPPAPKLAPKPVIPPPPQAPRVGEKVGFIQLPQRPAPRAPERPGQVKLPPGRQEAPRQDFSRRGGDIRGVRGPMAPGGQRPAPARPVQPAKPEFTTPADAQVITIKPPIVVRELAEQLKKKPFQLIADLIELKVMATVNQAIDENIAKRICAKYGFRFEVEKRERGGGVVHAPIKKVELDTEDKPDQLKSRAPVVTIMGHVDHGKTSLLDVIRKANVASGEAGGITQHIGAYTIAVPHPERKSELAQITFLDTPGHAAFSSMRARGANVTDIVVLVVAANDGVMPQTIEAMNHAKAAKVPILVAVNKIDHPNANALKVRQQLQDKGLVPDDWGGDTIFVDVSALTKVGIDKLLEMILLQADLLELKANPTRRAKGNVIESGIDPGGPTATVLVRKGTLRVGDVILCGEHYGRVRALINEEGQRLKEAGPSVAVKVLGLNGVPDAGLEFSAVEDEKAARAMAEQREHEVRTQDQENRSKVTLENLFASLEAAQSKSLKVVVKADTQGSVEAIVEALKKIDTDKVMLEVIHSDVGTI